MGWRQPGGSKEASMALMMMGRPVTNRDAAESLQGCIPDFAEHLFCSVCLFSSLTEGSCGHEHRSTGCQKAESIHL